jgi:hypothetical protein
VFVVCISSQKLFAVGVLGKFGHVVLGIDERVSGSMEDDDD